MRDALGAAYARHADKLLGFLLPRTDGRETAEDLAGDTWVKVARYIETYEDRGDDFGALVFAVARSVLTDWYRVHGRAPQTVPTDAPAALRVPAPPDGRLGLDLREAIGRLPPRQARVVALRFLAGCSQEQTARRLGNSINAVNKLQRRALDNLAVLLSA